MKAGFSRVDITPSMGIEVAGYFLDRFADGVLDNLEINALAVSAKDKTLLFLSLDHLGIRQEILTGYRQLISEKTGIPADGILISASHTHTGPGIAYDIHSEKVAEYRKILGDKLADAAILAIADLKPAKMGWKIGKAPNVAFVRRFRMKDGSVKTNPGTGNPDILEPIGIIDDAVSVLRFDRENAETIVFMNFANHPDTVGGSKISADWPGFARRVLERSIPNVKSLFVNGAQGDINHIDVNAAEGDMNDLTRDFDDVCRGYGHARHIGNVVAGAVMQVFDKVNYIAVDSIDMLDTEIELPANVPSPEDMPLAHKYNDLHLAGKDDEIPFEGMELTTVVAEAGRMVRLENGPESFKMKMTGARIGDIGFISIPGEGFNYIGRELKKTEGYKMIIPCGLTNAYEGYFPTRDAYDEGGYEARSSRFKAGVAENIVKEGRKILSDLNSRR